MKDDQRDLTGLAAVPARLWTPCLHLGHLIEETISVRKAVGAEHQGNTGKGKQESEKEAKIENLKQGNHTMSCLHFPHQGIWKPSVMMKICQIFLQKLGRWRRNIKGKIAWMT